MSIEAVSALSSALQSTQVADTVKTAASTNTGNSFDSLVRGFENINSQMADNRVAVESLATGQVDDLHRVMMNLESTSLAFDFALQVRNKVLDAYQELMRMQV